MTYDFTRFDGDRYFEEEEILKAANKNAASRELLIHMAPMDFLSAAQNLIYGERAESSRLISDLVRGGTRFYSLPMLYFRNHGNGTAEVVGHEGRHRAIAMARLGVKQMPVLLICNEGAHVIRWGLQELDGDRDQLKGPWPTELKQEKPDSKLLADMGIRAPRRKKIPFPVPDLRVERGWLGR